MWRVALDGCLVGGKREKQRRERGREMLSARHKAAAEMNQIKLAALPEILPVQKVNCQSPTR